MAPQIASANPSQQLQSIGPTAQRAIDDAVRELAEELDVAASVIRPGLSRFLGSLAEAAVPVDAAARMVLGLPKSTPPARAGRTSASSPRTNGN
jgi:hypothetical protein